MSTSRSTRLDNGYLSPERIQVARMRRGWTKTELAHELKVTPRTITKYETEGAPTRSAEALGRALGFPTGYFAREQTTSFDVAEVNFRAARKASGRQRQAAVAAGISGVEIDHWISERFALPPIDLPMLVGERPRGAARLLRGIWGLGTKPLPNLVQLAESRGVRVYSLPPFADAVDAYSIWSGGVPYVFLARHKTPERTRFDLAHELGHLVLHESEPADTTAQEREADEFASEFLMPAASVVEYLPRNPTLAQLMAVRDTFKVSAMAIAFAANRAGRYTEWAYRQTCIELSQRGYRSGEPGGMRHHEMSRVFPQVLSSGRSSAVTAQMIAEALDLPLADLHALTFGAELRPAQELEAIASVPQPRQAPPDQADGHRHLRAL
ncbi:XRE family transcriptional regulator [Williamsia herbipolensis]|uniref:XRE family transcriptional regulator n=1 Tax=Williamsia herbipolensis TaxID=1603258 RepID=A0AAU4JYB2_9NOCA|nr:XRE family transcriptional regulator [Williamsia herbipolensis]